MSIGQSSKVSRLVRKAGGIEMREPESQEAFDDEIIASGKSTEWCMKETENHLIRLRKEASRFSMELLMKHGYFNGEIESTVSHKRTDSGDAVILLSVVVSCYGLPWAFEDAEAEISRLKEIVEDCYTESCRLADDRLPALSMASLMHQNVVRSRRKVHGEA